MSQSRTPSLGRKASLFFFIGMLAIASAYGESPRPSNWTRFRGPNGEGVAKSKAPIPWAESDVRWKIDLPGQGIGSCVVWGSQYFVMSAEPNTAERYMISGSMDSGKILWKQTFSSTSYPLHRYSSYASSTPCVDESKVYIAWGDPEHVIVKAFTHSGEEVWERDFGRYVSQHGFGTSPMLVDDLVILCNYQDARELPAGVEPGEDHMIALDAKTGATRWSIKREATRVCYGVPCVMKDAQGRSVLIGANTGNGVFAIDAAKGEELWCHKTFEKRVCGSPVLVGDLILSSEGEGGGANMLVAIRSDGSGKEVYRLKKAAPYVPTPVVLGDLVFLWSDKGIVSCMEGSTGNVLWSERTVQVDVSSSPIIVGDKLLGIAQDGTVTVFAASREPEKIAEFSLGDVCRSTPAVTPDAILIRTLTGVRCIGK